MEGAVCPVCSADGMWLMEKDEETLKGGGFLKIVSYENVYRDQVIALVLSIENDEAKVGLTLADQPDLEDIDTHYGATGGGFWVAIDGENRVIGTLGLQVREKACGVMKKFFVAKGFRGKEYGVSAGLFARLMDCAAENGLESLVLDTPGVATRSHAFYRRMGFVEITRDELPIDYVFPDRDSLLFLKTL